MANRRPYLPLPLLLLTQLLCSAFPMTPEEKISKVASLESKFHKVLDNPCQASPEDILGCFFGTDYKKEDDFEHNVLGGHCIWSMQSLWFSGTPTESYDSMCQTMKDLVQKAAARDLPDSWDATVNGRMAQMILLDQVSRNAFRGTDQAFSNDALAMEHARVLTQTYLGRCSSNDTPLNGKFYPPYLVFMGLPFIHSEILQDHELALELLDTSRSKVPEHLHKWWDMQRGGSVAHKKVIQRFGRYPHRNRSLGRTNTPEEEEYLADVDNLPSWAKSQR